MRKKVPKRTCCCAKIGACEHYNLLITNPDLCKEWDYEKNKINPDSVMPGCNKKFSWICLDLEKNLCGCHKWDAPICDRVGKNNGCPFCRKNRVCPHNNLATKYPDLCKQWDYEKNEKFPNDFTAHSKNKAFWICPINPCGCHLWEATIYDRSGKNCGCPFCNKGRVCPHANLLVQFPDLCKEWYYEKNKNLLPENFSHSSEKIVWWKCEKGHSWECIIGSRTRKDPTSCPTCSEARYSKKQLDWLKKISEKYKIEIQTILSPKGELKIMIENRNYSLDGFAIVNNKKIAFEFDGCYWHGCENCYVPSDINQYLNKSFELLQSQTKEKKLLLESGGYMVISIKECEYNKNKEYCCEYDDILL